MLLGSSCFSLVRIHSLLLVDTPRVLARPHSKFSTLDSAWRSFFHYRSYNNVKNLSRVCLNPSTLSGRGPLVSCRNFSTEIAQKSKPKPSTTTDGEKDILLYTFQNDRYFKLLNVFGYVMWCFGTISAGEFLAMEIPSESESKVNDDLPWFAKFKFRSEFAKYVFAALTGLVGCGCLVVSWAYSLRSVCHVVLRKGRKQVTFVTYNPAIFKRTLSHTVNISDVSCQGSREKANLLPVKIRGKWFHFLLNKEGSYPNPRLFDTTVGLNRGF